MSDHTRKLLAIFLALMWPLSAPAADSQPAAVAELVAAARQEVAGIDMAAFRKITESPGEALIIDVRDPGEFATGHVPGAINIPRGLIEFRIWPFIGYPEHPDMATEQMKPPSTLQTVLRSHMVQSMNMNSIGVQPADIVIEPDVTAFDLTEFTRTDELAAVGEKTTLEAIPRIREMLGKLDGELFSSGF